MSTRVNGNVTLLDCGIGVNDSDQLVHYEGGKIKPLAEESAVALGMKLRTLTPNQLTAYGKITFYVTPANNVIAKMFYEADGRIRWVPMSGRKSDRPRHTKIAESHRAGETMFDPAEFKAR